MQREEDDPVGDATSTDRLGSILAELEQVDFERVDPPAELWDRIEATIASGPASSPREPPSRNVPSSTVVEYRIDADDVVIDVGQGWAEFARENGAPELATPSSSARTLWTYIDGEETAALWRGLVERVRRLQNSAEVPIRCDGPSARRWFDITITPGRNGSVHFRCVLVFEEARPPVSLLDLRSKRDIELESVPMCGWCGRGQHGSRWLDVEELVQAARLLERESLPPISHGICGSCRDEMSAELLVSG